MRTVTETYTAYTYNELDEDMKEKVLAKHGDINVDYDWWDGDYLGLTNAEMKSRRIAISDRWWESDKPKDRRGNIIGEYPAYTGLFNWDNLYFSLEPGSYIQFDGLWVANEDIFRRYLRIPQRLWETCDWDFQTGPGRDGTTRLVIESDYYFRTGFTEKQQNIVDRGMDIMNSHIDEALSNLQKEYEQRQTRAAIEESIKANEYEFNADGDIVG